jgi:hypothetical protein
MMATRVVDLVPPGSQLPCSICGGCHDITAFGINQPHTASPTAKYYSFCKASMRARAALAEWYTDTDGKRRRRYPDSSSVRAYMGLHAHTAAAPKLKTAGHVRPVKQDVSDEVKEARRLLREDAEAQRKGAIGHVYCVRERPLPTEQLVYGEYTNVVKVGHTYVTPPPARCAGLQTGNPRELVMVAFKPGSEIQEKKLHAQFIELNVLGEWFTLTDDIKKEFSL